MQHLEVARALLEHGVDVNGASTLGKTVLHVVLGHNRAEVDVIDLLPSAGVDINARTTGASTALHLAIVYPDTACSRIIDMLLQRGQPRTL